MHVAIKIERVFNMTKIEQQQFIEDACESLKEGMLAKLKFIPDNWDGYELRQYIKDTAEEFACMKMSPKRLKDYQNDVIVNNL